MSQQTCCQYSSFIIAFVGMQDLEEGFRRNRDQFTVQLRKENRQTLFKRRRAHQPQQNMEREIDKRQNKLIVDTNLKQLIDKIMEQAFNILQLEELCSLLVHPDPAQRHRAVIGLRIIVSEEENFELMQKIIDSGCVPILIKFMRQVQYPQLQLEATWILTNIACGRTSQCQSIIDKQGLQAFLQVISENRPWIAEQAVWGLGNIAGDNAKFRDIILLKGGLDVLMKAVEGSGTQAMVEQGAWAISNLCRGNPKPKYSLIKSAIPMLAKLVMSGILKQEDAGNCFWAIAANTEAQKTRIQQVVDIKGFVAHLFDRCLKYEDSKILAPVLRVIGNISNGNQLQTEELLRAGCLNVFLKLLDHPTASIKREACWIISNICVGTTSQIDQILNSKELLNKLIVLFQVDTPQVKKEICYIIGNICHCGQPESIFKLLNEFPFLEYLMQFLMTEEDGKCLEGGLTGLFEVMKFGEKLHGQNIIMARIEQQMGFLERLEALQNHPSQEVYQKLIRIIEHFFSQEATASDL